MKITQVELVHQLSPAVYYKMIICLSSEEYHWKKGMRVELKEHPEIIWTISEVFYTQEYHELNRMWDVGEL